MFRRFPWFDARTGARFAALFSAAVSAFSHDAIAVSSSMRAPVAGRKQEGAYSPVSLSVRVVDRNLRPVSAVLLHFTVDLDGLAISSGGQTAPDIRHLKADIVSNSAGIATFEITPPGGSRSGKVSWFRGRVRASVEASGDSDVGITPVGDTPLAIDEDLPLVNPKLAAQPTISIFERPTRIVDGFPIWSALGGRDKRIAVVLEGFDIYNQISATDNYALIAGAADALRSHGVSVLVVNYPDSHVSPDKLAPLARRAVQTAARLSGGKVALVGLSMGGLVGRWALCEAEATGTPLPVNSFLMLDSPNRGANINPTLQAMTLRYGLKADEEALESDAARALLTSVPGAIRWKQLGFGFETSRQIPADVTPDTHFHDEFYSRLRALNDRNGYPKTCRVVAIANSSRHVRPDDTPLLYLWLPWGFSWTVASLPADHAAGSTLPPYYGERFRIERIFGVAGAYMRSNPTFVANTSALDCDPGQTPPFDAWYARPDNLPPLPHDMPDPTAALFAVREVLSAAW